ncbi:transporter substrate-binding domain-containing protein [Leuconostoc pseudomesenteroides]|uniref:transporter substrate-binding domain-containing protein n=1 Tax=Leuconostoc pseudomesenteroides TaxID=33968 RepID=UPI001B8B0B4F|nr:transporter substrate-binding domain-containing protein [Leuconostoc pseudomesenteroides]MBS0958964.1 transporter substrate-binding domain-containing protein [Leuconostoc pseudomesenteroides]
MLLYRRNFLPAVAKCSLAILLVSTLAVFNFNSVSADTKPKTIKIGVRQDFYPTSYLDDKGHLKGYDIEVMKKIDKKLPQYKFKYYPVGQEALLIGLDTGKYAAAASGFYWSADREKKYLFPKENIGANTVGIVERKSTKKIKNLQQLAQNSSLKITPISGASGIYGIVNAYNEKNPTKKINFNTGQWDASADYFKWVIQKRYDIYITNNVSWSAVNKETNLKEQLVYRPFTSIKTFTIFNKNNKKFAKKYDKALKTIKKTKNKQLIKLSNKYFGENIFKYSSSK